MGTRTIEIADWVNLTSTVRGSKMPVMVGPTESRWNTRTPDGAGTLHLARTSDTEVVAEAWGPGKDWMLEQAPKLLGAEDDLTGFAPPPGHLAHHGDPRGGGPVDPVDQHGRRGGHGGLGRCVDGVPGLDVQCAVHAVEGERPVRWRGVAVAHGPHLGPQQRR